MYPVITDGQRVELHKRVEPREHADAVAEEAEVLQPGEGLQALNHRDTVEA
jgi:hypothetical protein